VVTGGTVNGIVATEPGGDAGAVLLEVGTVAVLDADGGGVLVAVVEAIVSVVGTGNVDGTAGSSPEQATRPIANATTTGVDRQ
jgi:hypothetical protein